MAVPPKRLPTCKRRCGPCGKIGRRLPVAVCGHKRILGKAAETKIGGGEGIFGKGALERFCRRRAQPAMALCSTILRKSTAPGSPVPLSTGLAIRKKKFKPIITGSEVSPIQASDTAVGLCLAV
jgi:hypothetical protein